MQTIVGLERNSTWLHKSSRASLRESYEEMLGSQERNFQVAYDGKRFYFHHMSLPIIIVPSVPGKTSIELYIPTSEMSDPRDLGKGSFKLGKMLDTLKKKGYKPGKLQQDSGYYYEIPVSTNLGSGIEKIARDCSSLVF